MKYLVRKEEMRCYDANTIEHFGIPSMVLIERAALAAVEELVREMRKEKGRILVAAGNGNNGADGLVMARLLHLAGHDVLVLTADRRTRATQENEKELAIAHKYGVKSETFGSFLARAEEDGTRADSFDVVVDAVFGVGLSRSIEGSYGQLLECLNGISGKKVAVDIPSGIDADDGSVLGVAFRADLTVTFSYEKLGMRLFPGQEYCGRIVCRSVGIDDCSFLAEEGGKRPGASAFTGEDLALVPDRRARTNKGSYGRVLVIAGSAGMAGAAYFSAKAAYLSGCGLVRVLTPEENRVVIQSILPEAVLTTYDGAHPARELAKDALRWADAIVCGPGFGTSDAARALVKLVLARASVPVVLDADALNILAGEPEALRAANASLVVTPHPGEMARLRQTSVPDITDNLVRTAEEFAAAYRLVCVLKDARTVTASPGGMTYVNLSGNNGMATGGSGDVLTGVIASLIAQGLKPELAAPLGVYIHGMAGDAAAKRVGKYGMTAQTLLEALPGVFLEAEKAKKRREGREQ